MFGGDDFAGYFPKEHQIAELLSRWESLHEAERNRVTSNQSELCSLIEGFLCDVFRSCGSGPASGWWCDGVTAVAVSTPHPKEFVIIGAAYWAEGMGHGSDSCLAPFELELHGVHSGGAERIVVRFGALDRAGEIKRSSTDATAEMLIARRPQRDGDWALAVELA